MFMLTKLMSETNNIIREQKFLKFETVELTSDDIY